MTDKVVIEARDSEDDKEYVNAIECSQEDAETLTREWRRIYGHVSVRKEKTTSTGGRQS
jgi:hypothetical protein